MGTGEAYRDEAGWGEADWVETEWIQTEWVQTEWVEFELVHDLANIIAQTTIIASNTGKAVARFNVFMRLNFCLPKYCSHMSYCGVS